MKKLLLKVFICLILCQASAIFAADTWKELRSRHFIIYYKNAPVEFIKMVEKSAEEYYYSISEDLGFSRDQLWTWEDRAKIYIYDDEADYVSSSRQAPWSSGSVVVAARAIQTYPSAHGFFDSLLPHELGHIVLHEYIGSRASTPLWFGEGVAMYQEKAKRLGADKDVKQAIQNGSFIPLSALSSLHLSESTDREIVNLFYAEAASVVHYLISQSGSFKFKSFCQELREGSKFDQALERTYYRYKNIDDLNNAWIGYLKK